MATITEFGPFRLDVDANILFQGAEVVPLGQRAVTLLRLFLERPGTPISKQALIEAAWPGLAIEDSNLTVQIAALRRVFADAAGGAGWIETLPRRGYRYVGPLPAAAGALGDADRPALASPGASVAALPFSNLSGDPDQDYFVDGMVEDIIAGLSRIKWLSVAAHNSGRLYEGRALDLKRVGRELGVRYLLRGSLRKDNSRIRVSARMIEAETGDHLWAERYDRPLEDIFALQDEIALSVVGAIEPSLRKAEVERVKRKRPDNLDAYDLVLRAQPEVYSGMPEGATQALILLESALALEPGLCVGARFRSDVPSQSVPARWTARGQSRSLDPPCSLRDRARPGRRPCAHVRRIFHRHGRARSRRRLRGVRGRARRQSLVSPYLHSWRCHSRLGRRGRTGNCLE